MCFVLCFARLSRPVLALTTVDLLMFVCVANYLIQRELDKEKARAVIEQIDDALPKMFQLSFLFWFLSA